jgi:hypothetical protein
MKPAPRVPYSAEISRANPSCFLFLIDQSGSMAEPFGDGSGRSKSEGVASAINRLLQTLVLRCAKAEGVRNCYEVGVIGYGSGGVGPALGGALAGRPLVPLSDLAYHPLRVEERSKLEEDGAGGLVERKVRFPVWFEPRAGGVTPMCTALGQAADVLTGFLRGHPDCFPPVVINLTDGQPTDGEPEEAAARLCALASSDGNVLLFNLHISSRGERPIEFPERDEELPSEPARRLFRISSALPRLMQVAARQEGFPISAATRGFVFNADLVSVIRFLDIGTRNELK